MKNQTITPWLDRPLIPGLRINREQALYVLIIVLCLLSRLAILGYRVQSHDESLHTQYSWYLYRGQIYRHNPMMHGPFLYHATAFTYFLFGDNDYTARVPVALIGTLIVAFPYLLRRYLGRTGALATSTLLLISPSIMYYSRYIRHDIPVMLWAIITIWSILRYLEEGKARHLYFLAGGLSLMYATKEVSFIYTAILGLFLAGLFLIQAMRLAWQRPQAEPWFLGALGVALVGLFVLFLGVAVGRAQESGPPPVWAVMSGVVAVVAAIVAIVALLVGLGARARSLRTFDLIILIGTLIIPYAAPLAIEGATRLGSSVVERSLAIETVSPFWIDLANLNMLDYTRPHIYYSGVILTLCVLAAIGIGLLWDWRRWSIAAAIYGVIFLVLYTTVFTNGAGVASGWIGSLGYWLEQHEVQRGNQPMYYYLVILPFYDFLPLLGALSAVVYLLVRSIIALARWIIRSTQQYDKADVTEAPLAVDEQLGATQPVPFIPLLLFWSIASWLGYSYAGERMPWLVVHISLPMIWLTGWLVGRLLKAIDWRGVWEKRAWLLVPLAPALIAALAATLRAGGQGPFGGVEVDALVTTGEFLSGLAGVALLGALVGFLWARAGWRQSLLVLALTAVLALTLLTVRIAYRFSFVNMDYPTEFLVYAHESDDVRETMAQLEALSMRVGGGPQLIDVTYGSDGSWPFVWYLRNYPNARFYPDQPSRDQVLATAIIAGQRQWDVVDPYVGDDYYSFEYTFLWWPMEDYRQLTWERLWEWLRDPQKRAALWQIFYRREYTLYDEITGKHHTLDRWPLRQRYRLYVRRDVVNRLWDWGVGQMPESPPGLPPGAADPYGPDQVELTARLMWGSEGSGPGQFNAPRGIAVAPNGTVYVADSRNHRIQRFDANGTFLGAWGTLGGCEGEVVPGAFCEPWGVAVAPDGTVYVADTWGHRIQRFDADGAFLGAWGSFGDHSLDGEGEGFYGPRDVAVGPGGRIYVADTGNKRVQVFEPDGTFVRQFGGRGWQPGQLDEPVGLAFTPDGDIVVADTWNYRVQVLTTGGRPIEEWRIDGWNNPMAEEKAYVAVDADGRIYVTDPGGYRVLVFDAAGEFLFTFGRFGFDESSFALPMGIAVGPDGSVYVTDAGSHRVLVFEVP